MVAESHVERRRHPRREVSIPARMNLLGYTADGTLENISTGGVRFTTADQGIHVIPGNFVTLTWVFDNAGSREAVVRTVQVTRIVSETREDKVVRVFGMQFAEPVG